ncbi:MAG: CBS domain-containing protein [Acidobacteria bacterium]|nr:MAG: CBS domain-containing protein [Acidobacteriota bacterium]
MRLATTHLNADADGLAGMVALRRLYGPLELVLPGGVEPTARRIWEELSPGLPEIGPLPPILERLDREGADLLLVADTARAERLGPLGDRLGRVKKVRAFDTHGEAGADLPRARLPRAASCAAALALRLHRRGLVPPAAEATLFLLAIHVDSKGFTAPETTAADHRAAALCLRWGADPSAIPRLLPSGLDRRRLSLLEEMARSARIVETPAGPVALLTVERERFEPDLSTLLGQLRDAEGWPAAFLVASLGGRLYLMARSTGQVDVGAVLRSLGGGGHPSAAGATLRGMTLRDAREVLAEAIRAHLGRRPTAGELAVRPFVSLAADRSIGDAADLMDRHGLNALPLRAAGKREFVGVVTRQEVDAALRHGLAERPVSEIAARPPAWVAPEADLAQARRALSRGGRILLVGEPPDRAVGILTRTALLQAEAGPAPPGDHGARSRRSVLERTRRALGSAWGPVERVGAVAAELGFAAHLVGGTVRDLLLGRKVRDIDVVVEGDALRLAQVLAEREGGELRLHEPFGTARWTPPGGPPIDLATARAEYYERPGSLPSVHHAGLRRDLYRRDFTINAMAISIDPAEAGLLRDPFGGYEDLKRGLLRVLHGLSFQEDPTRAFRAARFAARLGFRLAPHTEGLLRGALRSGAFDRVSPSRLGREIDRILAEPEVSAALRLLREWDLIETIHPALRSDRGLLERATAVRNAWHELSGLWAGSGDAPPPPSEPLWIALAAAIPLREREAKLDLVPRGRERRRRWLEGPERAAAAIERVERAADRAEVAEALEGLDAAERTFALGTASGEHVRRRLRWWEREGRHIRPAIGGEDLIGMGIPPGPRLGRALRAAQRLAWNGASPEEQKAAARAYAESGTER